MNASLYLIEILHQTTTRVQPYLPDLLLYLIEILHQTTTCGRCEDCLRRCILSKFYIKPQPCMAALEAVEVVSYRNSTSNHNPKCLVFSLSVVVSYRNSTSNHNISRTLNSSRIVVSYRNSTSNHNSASATKLATLVVSYRNSTSNHNPVSPGAFSAGLYLIEILHQTTTRAPLNPTLPCCILSKFYIKPQPCLGWQKSSSSCILSKFYIKPQLPIRGRNHYKSCILSKFYIKPQLYEC